MLYHRVAKVRSEPWPLTVTPRHFAEHLKILREHAKPIQLRHLSQALLDGNLPDRSVVLTFDDGYADNLYNAKPILERYEVPATCFLTTGYIGRERELWWDELEQVLLQPTRLPERLHLRINGRAYQWKVGQAAHYSEGAFRRSHDWKALFRASNSRHRLYQSIWKLLLGLTEGERRKMLNELLAWAGVDPVSRPSHRILSAEEVVALEKGGLVEVGAHTVAHSALSALSEASQRDEILKSKVRIEEILGHPVTSFAYPFGWRSAYTTRTIAMVREAEFTCACASFAEVVGPSTDRFQLPRIQIQDWGREEFAKRLSKWCGFH